MATQGNCDASQNIVTVDLPENMSYSSAAAGVKSDQAIVMDAIETLTVDDYAEALIKIIKPENILYISKISMSRICVFLNSAQLVDQISNENNNILKIKEHKVTIRPLKSKAKRVIFSNVYPIIPSSVITDTLEKRGIRIKSQLINMKASIYNPRLAHVHSFRQQIYIDQDDVDKLPSEIRVNHNAITYHIFVSTDKVKCFLCNKEGHMAKQCTQPHNHGKEDQQVNSMQLTQNEPRKMQHQFHKPSLNDNKRQRTSTASNSASIETKKLCQNATSSNSQEQIAQTLADAKNEIEKSSELKDLLDLDTAIHFIEDTYNAKLAESHTVAAKYTQDVPKLILTVQEFRKHVNLKGLKSRLTKVKRILAKTSGIILQADSNSTDESQDDMFFSDFEDNSMNGSQEVKSSSSSI